MYIPIYSVHVYVYGSGYNAGTDYSDPPRPYTHVHMYCILYEAVCYIDLPLPLHMYCILHEAVCYVDLPAHVRMYWILYEAI